MTDDPAARTSSPESVLAHLIQSGNLDRVVIEAKRFLCDDPEDATAHYYLALALIDLKQMREARIHLDQVLSREPDSARARLGLSYFHLVAEHWSELARQSTEALGLYPEVALFHYYAALAALGRGRVAPARFHIDRARELDPDDADIANLHINIHGIGSTSAADSLRRLDEYQAALQLDPQNAFLHHSLGNECLDGLDDPREAESHYRDALRLDPANRLFQTSLFQAVAKRSPVYRLFSIPTRTFGWIAHVGRGLALRPWRIIFLLIGFKAVLAFGFWLLLTTVLLWPGAKAYEWLLVSEIRNGARASDAKLRAWFWVRRWPRWIRFLLFLAANLVIWGGLFALIGLPLEIGYILVFLYAGIHAFFVLFFWSIRQLGAAEAKRTRRRALAVQGRRESEIEKSPAGP